MKYTNSTIRINIIFILGIVLLFVLFFVKLSYIALNSEVEGTNLAELAKNRSIATRVVTADRGRIYDNDGNLLAQNVNSYTLIAYLDSSRTTNEKFPKHVREEDKERVASSLAEVLSTPDNAISKEYILSRLNQKGLYQTEFGLAGKGLTENKKRQIEALDLPGIDFIKTSKRYYQNGDFASYIVGYAKTYEKEGVTEIVGELGIEGYCNRYLKGKDGKITYQKDAYGYQMALNDNMIYKDDALDGYDVYLTLDKQVQIFLDNAAEDMKKYNPEWISITVADAKTGAIIASSTSPSFNPNILDITNYNNPLTSFTYEPGSTMKIFSFMTAMEEGKYDGGEYYQSGRKTIADYTIKDWNNYGWGKITYDVGFTYSSNVAAANLAERVGKKTLKEYYNNLGFGSLTGIELSNELAGDVDFDYDIELASASYGQGITVTPIQMIQALTSITNDGTVLKPYVIDKIVDPNTGKTVYQGKRSEVKKVYSTSTVNKIVELMDLTVNGEDKAATGRGYHTDAVRFIGKTGTANYVGPNGKYITGSSKNIRSFAGIFPKENPEYIIYVAVKDFNGTSKNLGNAIRDLVESVSKYRNLDERPSDKDETKIVCVGNYLNTSLVSSQTKLINLGVNPVIIGNGNMVINQYPLKDVRVSQKSKVFLVTNGSEITMPDMKGWSSSELISFCNLVGIPYEINGYGYVESTNVLPGAIIDASTVVSANLVNIEAGTLTNGGI